MTTVDRFDLSAAAEFLDEFTERAFTTAPADLDRWVAERSAAAMAGWVRRRELRQAARAEATAVREVTLARRRSSERAATGRELADRAWARALAAWRGDGAALYPSDSGADGAPANASAITRYVREVLGEELVADARANLAARPLGCYCPLHMPCHADVLLLVAAGADPEDALAEVLARHRIGSER